MAHRRHILACAIGVRLAAGALGAVWPSSPCRAAGQPAATRPAGPAAAAPTLLESTAALRRGCGLRLLATGEMPKPSWEVVRFNPLLQKDAPTRDAYAAIVVEELVRYDAAWIGRSKVTTVALVGRLTVDGQSRAGVPDYLAGVLYLDPFVGAFNDTYRRHVIHHELFHAVEAAVHGDPYFDDPAWRRMNDPAFRYGSGGAASRDAAVTVLNHPAAGFINQYAEAAVEEDKAELFAALMTPAEAPLIGAGR